MGDGPTTPNWGHVLRGVAVAVVAPASEVTTNWRLLGATGRARGTKAPATGWCSTFLMTDPTGAGVGARKEGFGGIIPENAEDGHGLQDQERAIASVIGGTAEAAVGTGDDEMERASSTSLKPRWCSLATAISAPPIARNLVSTVTCVTVTTAFICAHAIAEFDQ